MATNFPNSIDSLINPLSGEPLNSPNQANIITDLNAAVLALQAKVGTTTSSDSTSLDYKIRNITTTGVTYSAGAGITLTTTGANTASIINNGIISIVAGAGITINTANSHNPTISVTGGGGGGGGTWPTYSGSGSPTTNYGNVAPAAAGNTYVDSLNGSMYISTGTTSASWVAVGGKILSGVDTGLYSDGTQLRLYANSLTSGGIDIENYGPNGLALVDLSLAGVAIASTTTGPISIGSSGGGIQLQEVGHNGINIASNPVGSSQGHGYYIYTANTEANLYSTPNTPAWGYTDDGLICFNSGTGWTIWSGVSSKEVLAQAAPGATPAINTNLYGVVHFTTVNTNVTNMTTNLTGTPGDGDALRISFTDNGTSRTINWGAKFESSNQILPLATVANTRMDIGFIWNTETTGGAWRCVALTGVDTSGLPLAGGTMTGPITGLQDRGGQVFNVKAYGAKGDTSTDDLIPIQTAINAAVAANGTVFFPAGVYTISNTLNVTGSCVIDGAGKGAIIRARNAFPSTAPMLFITSISKVTTRNIVLDCDNFAPYGHVIAPTVYAPVASVTITSGSPTITVGSTFSTIPTIATHSPVIYAYVLSGSGTLDSNTLIQTYTTSTNTMTLGKNATGSGTATVIFVMENSINHVVENIHVTNATGYSYINLGAEDSQYMYCTMDASESGTGTTAIPYGMWLSVPQGAINVVGGFLAGVWKTNVQQLTLEQVVTGPILQDNSNKTKLYNLNLFGCYMYDYKVPTGITQYPIAGGAGVAAGTTYACIDTYTYSGHVICDGTWFIAFYSTTMTNFNFNTSMTARFTNCIFQTPNATGGVYIATVTTASGATNGGTIIIDGGTIGAIATSWALLNQLSGTTTTRVITPLAAVGTAASSPTLTGGAGSNLAIFSNEAQVLTNKDLTSTTNTFFNGPGTNQWLISNLNSVTYSSTTRNTSGSATAGTVVWPDGTTGVYTATVVNASGAIDSYTVTYATRTVTQPTVTRDVNGAVTAQPAITVA